MNRRSIVSICLLLALLIPMVSVSAQGGSNLLSNPGFEGFYRSFRYGNAPEDLVLEFRVADGWNPWYRPQGADDPEWRYRRPEYRPASYSYNGSPAQQFFTSFGTHQAGVFQRVSTAAAGRTYRFSVAAYIWSSNGGNFYSSDSPGNARVRVGIDPLGGTNAYAASVVWSPFATFYDSWRVLSVDAVAASRTLTVFVWSEQDYPVVHNDVALDDAYLGLSNGAPASAVGADSVDTPLSDTAEEVATARPVTAPNPGRVTFTSGADVRQRGAIYGKVLNVIPAGMPVSVLGRSADRNWAFVEYNGQQGWVGSWLGVFSVVFDSIPVVPTN